MSSKIDKFAERLEKTDPEGGAELKGLGERFVAEKDFLVQYALGIEIINRIKEAMGTQKPQKRS